MCLFFLKITKKPIILVHQKCQNIEGRREYKRRVKYGEGNSRINLFTLKIMFYMLGIKQKKTKKMINLFVESLFYPMEYGVKRIHVDKIIQFFTYLIVKVTSKLIYQKLFK